MKYIPNPSFEKEFNASADALAFVEDLATRAAAIAAEQAPKLTEDLAKSIEATAGVVDGVATGRVNAFDFKAHWYEFGNQRHGPQPYLRPAVEAVVGRPVKE